MMATTTPRIFLRVGNRESWKETLQRKDKARADVSQVFLTAGVNMIMVIFVENMMTNNSTPIMAVFVGNLRLEVREPGATSALEEVQLFVNPMASSI